MSRIPIASRVRAEAERLVASGKVYYSLSEQFAARSEAKGLRPLVGVLREQFQLSEQRLRQLLFATGFDVKSAYDWALTQNNTQAKLSIEPQRSTK